jgi:hypothetical protein
MGMRTIIYGYIEEMDFWKRGPVSSYVRKHNSRVISGLPIADRWPPVSKEMFTITNNFKNHPGPNFEYSGRVIHFAANLKSVEMEWKEWKKKFELLLFSLFFLEAKVHFQTEYSSVQTTQWRVDLLKYHVPHDGSIPSIIDPTVCDFESTYE